MAGDEVSAEAIPHGHGAFQVDQVALAALSEGGLVEGLGGYLNRKQGPVRAHYGHAGAVHGNALTEYEVGRVPARPDFDQSTRRRLAVARDGADRGDDAGEHATSPLSGATGSATNLPLAHLQCAPRAAGHHRAGSR